MKNLKTFTLIIILIINSNMVFCQAMTVGNEFNGIIKDKDTGEKLQYVNVGIKNSTVGTVSDLYGNFRLFIPDNLESDSISFSCIGYKDLNIKITRIERKSYFEVMLQPEIYILSETNVTSDFLKQKTRGLVSKSKKMVAAINGETLGSEIGSPIRLLNKETILKSLHCNMTFIKPDSAIFRLKIYDFSGDTIGVNLLDKNVIFIIKKTDLGEFQLNLLPYNILVYDDVFIAIELLNLYTIENTVKTSFSDRINISIGIDLMNGGIFQKKAGFSHWENLAKKYTLGIWLTTLE